MMKEMLQTEYKSNLGLKHFFHCIDTVLLIRRDATMLIPVLGIDTVTSLGYRY